MFCEENNSTTEQKEEILNARWKVERKIGSGSYGCIFQGKNIYTSTKIAIKKFKENNIDEGISSSTLREIVSLRKLKHQNIISVIVQVADAISAARPGARRETLESYIKRLDNLEKVSDSFKGVEKSFAIRAGRELRIIVVPSEVSDIEIPVLARDIARKIENELEYPGQIKVNVIRETRAIEYAQ